ncbi:uncharacterized protein LOC111009395 [Momordica charantia]|uniref:Uncharacterized protein LOC111009395 n=1 Tax=Momordica charantia TaxID=3673 RepID=A0A6J1CC88_MOMCH|nr:uncharacterized protein LOC111009395 [Momordica charantia]
MKRKWEDCPQAENIDQFPPDIELHLETPLPLEWQRCLDIQSGQIHFYNTKTRKRSFKDPRRPDQPRSSPGEDDPLSLDLELNLNCQSKKKSDGVIMSGLGRGSIHGPSWLRLEREEQAEMVARVCMQCHLLVMVLKSSPTCPNCKFIHPIPTDLQIIPPTTTTTTLFIASHPTKDQTQSLKRFSNAIQNKV